MARISAKSAVGHYSPVSESENSDYNSPGQPRHRLNNRSVVRRGPLMDVDINSVDSDDNSDYSPVGTLKTTSGRQLTRLEPKGYDTSNFKINLPLKNPAKQQFQGTPSPLKNSNRVDFAPTRSVVSYSKASSPSKLLGDASNLLSKNRTPPGSFYSDTPSKATNVPQQDEWIDEEEEEANHDANNVYDESMTDDQPSNQQVYYPRQYQQQQHDNYIPRYNVFWDPDTPSTVSAWVQIIFNVLVAGSILYFFYLFVSTIRHDIDMKVEEYSAEILAEMSVCSKEYINNNCMPGKRVPALEKMCNSWEKCMNRDPAVVGRAKVGAEAFGEIVEGFTKPISWKTIIFIVCFVGGTTLISNVSLMYTRRNLGGYRRQQQQERKQSPRKTPRKPKTPSPHQTPYYTPRSTRTGMPSSHRPRRRHV